MLKDLREEWSSTQHQAAIERYMKDGPILRKDPKKVEPMNSVVTAIMKAASTAVGTVKEIGVQQSMGKEEAKKF